MSFLEAEFPRSIMFKRVGGQKFNTAVLDVQSGQEQRNRNWQNPRAEYVASLNTSAKRANQLLQFVEDVRTFFLLVGGMADGFRYYDPVDCVATNEPMVAALGGGWQLQKTYFRFGRTYVRTITKPIIGTNTIWDYQGNYLADTLTVSGGSIVSVDHTTGIVQLSGVTGTPTASFRYHIPVRLTSDKFEPELQESNLNPIGGGPVQPIIEWHSLGLIEVRPPNY
jgi:uncharacterized protein (TIGR02217 family)